MSNLDIVDFQDAGHIYTNRRTNTRYKSVTTFKDQFKRPFPREYMSLYKAIEALTTGWPSKQWKDFKNVQKEYGNEEGLKLFIQRNKFYSESTIRAMQKTILAVWDEKKVTGQERGTKWHNKQEDKALIQRKVFTGTNNLVLSPYYTTNPNERPRLSYDLPDGVYVELLMALHEFQLAGQADSVFLETIGKKRYVDIDDWKTDKNLTWDNDYNQYFLSPIDELKECSINGYAIQLSMYMRMCEYYGFIPRKISITHVRESIKSYPIPYLKKEVDLLLDYRKNELILAV